MGDRGTKPSSSTISRLRRESCLWRLSRRLSSLASINSWTRAAAVVNPTDIPFWQAARPSPRAMWVLPVPLLPTAMIFSRRCTYSHRASSITRRLVHRRDGGKVEGVHAFDGREAGSPDPPLHHALVAVDEFQFAQPQQIGWVVHSLGGALGRHLPVFPEEAGQFQFLQMVFQQQRRPVAHAALPDSNVM